MLSRPRNAILHSAAAVSLATFLASTSTAHAASISVTNAPSGAAIAAGGDFTGHTGHTGYPGIYAKAEFSAAESFAGQTVALVGGYETVTGWPSGALLVPAAANGVTLYHSAVQGQSGNCGDPCTGEGAVTFSFAAPQAAIGLDIPLFEGNETVTAQFIEPGGTPYDVIVLSHGALSWTFTAPSGHTIAGVTFTNTDQFGVAYDDLRLTPAPPVPVEPATWGRLKALYR
jgi:hypothetical protein